MPASSELAGILGLPPVHTGIITCSRPNITQGDNGRIVRPIHIRRVVACSTAMTWATPPDRVISLRRSCQVAHPPEHFHQIALPHPGLLGGPPQPAHHGEPAPTDRPRPLPHSATTCRRIRESRQARIRPGAGLRNQVDPSIQSATIRDPETPRFAKFAQLGKIWHPVETGRNLWHPNPVPHLQQAAWVPHDRSCEAEELPLLLPNIDRRADLAACRSRCHCETTGFGG